MKQNLFYAFASAIALTGAVGFSSCSDKNDVAEVNPNYNSETNEVPVNFVLSIATNTNSTASTRSNITSVQENGNFRGMEGVKMFAFATGTKKAVQKNDPTNAYYNLDKLLSKDAITTDQSNRVVNINIPVGTDAFLFYGKAIKDATKTELNQNEIEGKIDFNVSLQADNKTLNTQFSLQPRLSESEAAKLRNIEELVAAIINDVLDVSHSYTPDGGSAAVTMTLAGLGATYHTEIDYAPGQKTLTPLELSLGEAYYKVTTLGTNELRAGCAWAVLDLAKELRNTFYRVNAATPTGTQETAAHALANAALTKWSNYFGYDNTNNTASFNVVSTIKSSLGTSWKDAYNSISDAELSGFPQCFGLPAGSSLMVFDVVTKKFKYKSEAGTTDLEKGLYNRDKIMYPAELTYYCNGPIRTSSVEKLEAGYPNGTINWTTESAWVDKGNWSSGASEVTSSTRAAALMPNVNYGVAMLKSTVKLVPNDNETIFLDNRHANTGEDDRQIPMGELKLNLVGILIGGQCQTVGWDFVRRETTGTFDNMIYDNRISGQNSETGVSVPTSGEASSANYTLVFDNYVCGETIADAGTVPGQNDVLVALEFVNQGDDFWGQGNLVRKGGTFYLVGKLTKPTAEQNSSFAWPSAAETNNVNRFYEVPPIKADGTSVKIARVFVQDYKTEATFKIGKTSLQHAYVTVPDLRSTQMSFGLSVDLSWKAGMSYTDDKAVILGD